MHLCQNYYKKGEGGTYKNNHVLSVLNALILFMFAELFMVLPWRCFDLRSSVITSITEIRKKKRFHPDV